MKISIIGLCYVGLPLSLVFNEAGVKVLGLDIDEKKTNSIKEGKSDTKHIGGERIASVLAKRLPEVDTDCSRVKECEAVLTCVPTPLNMHREPNLSYILNTGEAIAPFLKRGTLAVLESTTYPGTTEDELRQVLEEGSEMVAGRDFHLAYSPESRESPKYVIMEKLEALGATVEYNDPYIPVIKPSREYSKYAGKKSVEILDDFDLIVLVIDHVVYDRDITKKLQLPFLSTKLSSCADINVSVTKVLKEVCV